MTKSPIKKPLYGFLIDPRAQNITRIEMPADSRGNLDAMYKAIGCSLVEVVYINGERDGVFVDEEGLLKMPTEFFFIKGFHQPLAGRGIVLGCDGDGETTSPASVTLEWLREHTAFVHRLAPGVTAITSPSELADQVESFFA
jgi:hypothetical protein